MNFSVNSSGHLIFQYDDYDPGFYLEDGRLYQPLDGSPTEFFISNGHVYMTSEVVEGTIPFKDLIVEIDSNTAITGGKLYVSPTHYPENGQTYDISWGDVAGSITSGTLNVLTGELTTGGTTYQITPIQVKGSYGVNNVWLNFGTPTSVEIDFEEHGKRDHSLTFYTGTIKLNTYDNWHLVPTSRPLVASPSPKTKYLEIPGANGKIDMSDSLTGYPVFNNRTGDWTFYVLNDYGEWYERYSSIMTSIQGRKLKVILEDDPEYYYEGRFYVSSWASEEGMSQLTINYDVAPYKVKCAEVQGPNGTVYLADVGGNSL